MEKNPASTSSFPQEKNPAALLRKEVLVGNLLTISLYVPSLTEHVSNKTVGSAWQAVGVFYQHLTARELLDFYGRAPSSGAT